MSDRYFNSAPPFYFQTLLDRAASITGFAKREIIGEGRAHRFMPVRFAMVYLLREAGLSFPQIGKRMNRDHTTVMDSYRRARDLLAKSAEFADLVVRLATPVTSQPVCWTVPASVSLSVKFAEAA